MFVCAALAPLQAQAAAVNPYPATFGTDTGASLFHAGSVVASAELLDVPGQSEFGFYYRSNPATLIAIFGREDQSTLGNPQTAVVNFAQSRVVDYDESVATSSVVVQSLFAPQSGPIGFYLSPYPGYTLYSDSSLNPSGLDAAGVFPELRGAGYGIAFEDIETHALLSFHYVTGVAPVPLPAAMFLFASGLSLVGCMGIKKRSV